jgi:hypothetical protein
LFKATRTEHARAPSIGSIRTLRSSRRSCARCSLARTSPRTLSLASSPACPVKGRQLASSYPAALGSSRVAPLLTAPARKMRLSDFCNRLTTRAPTVLPDSRSRSLRASQPCDHATLRSRYQVKLRLTANLQLRPCHNPRGASWAEARSSPPSDTARYWYESLDRKLSRAVPLVRRLVSRARACRPTSDVLYRDCPARPCLSAGLALAAVGLRLHRRLVKSSCFVETRAPSLDECPLLRASLPAPACATAGNQTRIHREPATVPTGWAGFGHRFHPSNLTRTSPAWYRTAIPAIARGSIPRHVARGTHRARVSRRLLQSNSPRAQPRTIRTPVETADATHPARAGLGGNPPGGVGAPSASSTADSGRHHSFRLRLDLAASAKTSA